MPRLTDVANALFLAAVIAAAAAAPAGGESLEAQLGPLIDAGPAARRTAIACKVVDVAAGEVLFDRGGDRLFVPASNLKIYTSACALDLFDPRHTFATTVVAKGPIRDGVLLGDLILVGGGDSMLAASDLPTLATRVVEKWGLRQVRGKVRVDNSRYVPRLKGPGWMWDDDPAYYNMSVTPLMVDFNVLKVQFSPPASGGSPPAAQLAPPSTSPPLVLQEDATAKQVAIERRPFTEPIVVRYPPGGGDATAKSLTMHDPGPWAAGLFQEALANRGVRVEAPPSDQAPTQRNAADDDRNKNKQSESSELEFTGRPLVDAINHFHAVSENAVGEVLIHEIAIRQGIERPDWPDGAAAITKWLTGTAGLEKDSFRIVDGSGLSRYNLVTADSAIRLLTYMHRHRHAKLFFESLPRYQLDDATDADRDVVIAAKPGGMQSVATISGYLRTRSGRLLAFSLLANGYVGGNEPLLQLRQSVWRAIVENVP